MSKKNNTCINQHYVPQMLLRGFSSDGKTVACFRKGNETANIVNTRSVGFEKNFYSSNDDMFLDDTISTHEKNRIAPLLRSLREASHNEEVAPSDASEIVWHFNVRTKFFRDFFRFTIDNLYQEFVNEKHQKAILAFLVDKFTSDIDIYIGKEVEKIMPHNLEESYFIIKAKTIYIIKKILLEHPRILDECFANSHFLLAQFGEKFQKSLPHMLQGFHKNILKKYYTTNLINEWLMAFRWKIYEHETEVILPDCVSLTVTNQGVFPFLLNSGENDVSIILPIHNKKLLIGSIGCIEFDINTYNLHAARNSECWFVTHPDYIDKYGYHNLIGANITDTLKKDLLQIFYEFFAKKHGVSQSQHSL